QARSWFEKAARHGYAPAQVNLAVTYINGWGVSQNYGAALNWLNAAAKQGHPSAYANLGILYMNGWGVRRDYAEAFKDLERPAMREPSPTLAISMTAASALARTTPPQRAGINSPRKTATPSARTISPTSASAAKAFAKAIRKPSIGFRNPLSKGTRGPASSS